MELEQALTRIREIIDEHTSQGPYTPRLVAQEILEKLKASEPEVLRAWLDGAAEQFLWEMINRRDHSKRGHAVHRAKSAAFQEVLDSEEGEQGRAQRFLDAPYTVEDGTRRRLADLTNSDLVFVAEKYEDRAKTNAMAGAFMRALSKKVKGGSVVADKFTEEQLHKMWDSVS